MCRIYNIEVATMPSKLFHLLSIYLIISKNLLALEFLLYKRYDDYKYYPDYSSSNTALRLYIRHII